ncbi:hypothetical protein DGWBC_0603 [Dehalogenimonas sp. WBC-2]|nr:hypothetical protein DGWBC_0603 [Dehalogenimonas sp. WBC-2]
MNEAPKWIEVELKLILPNSKTESAVVDHLKHGWSLNFPDMISSFIFDTLNLFDKFQALLKMTVTNW